jgi:hypothetical protein
MSKKNEGIAIEMYKPKSELSLIDDMTTGEDIGTKVKMEITGKVVRIHNDENGSSETIELTGKPKRIQSSARISAMQGMHFNNSKGDNGDE